MSIGRSASAAIELVAAAIVPVPEATSCGLGIAVASSAAMARFALGLLLLVLMAQVIGVPSLLPGVPCPEHCPLDATPNACPPLCVVCGPLATTLPPLPTERVVPLQSTIVRFSPSPSSPAAAAFTRDISHVPKFVTV